MNLPTLRQAAVRFRLKNPSISNEEIATALGMLNINSDPHGVPYCFFFRSGVVAAIRTEDNELVIFHLFESVQTKMDDLGERIPNES